MDLGLAGAAAVVTGGTQGMGQGFARAFVNTVGPSATGTIDRLTDEQWHETFEIGAMNVDGGSDLT